MVVKGTENITGLLTYLIAYYMEYLRKNKKLRYIITVIFAFLLLISIGIRIFSNLLFDTPQLWKINEFLLILILIFVAVFIITLASFTEINLRQGSFSIALEKITTEREELNKKLSKDEDSVYNTIQLSLNRLSEYYTINIRQAKSSYNWSITAIVVGIMTLVIGIWLLYFSEKTNINLVIITGISGAIIEFIGASNIFIYNKSIKQLNIYFNELVNLQDTMLAIELSDKIEDPVTKATIIEKIILSLMGRSSMKPEFMVDHNKKNKSP